MKVIQNIWNKTLIIGLTSLIVACGNEQETKDEEIIEPQHETIESSNVIDFVMPSPLQIASIFKRAGLTYQEGLANSPDKVSNYSSKLSKTLNFGVYAADLSYCVLNNKSQESINYMKAVKQLSDDLGMSAVFASNDLFTNFEKNVGNEDSMIYILASVQENLDEHLETNEEQYLSVVLFAGGWIEGMYIGSKVAEQGNNSITIRLVEQMVILGTMIESLEKYPHKSIELDNIIAEFKGIENLYQNFDAIKNQKTAHINFDDLKLTEEELKIVSEKISALRSKIVNG